MQDHLNEFLGTPYGIAIIFVILWCAICYSLSFLSGWHSLTRRFKKQSEPYGETKSLRFTLLGVRMRFGVKYDNFIRITAAEDALYLFMLFFFRLGHPPLRIPWNEIQFGRTKYFWMSFVVLTLGNEEFIPMRISEGMARKLGILERLPNDARAR